MAATARGTAQQVTRNSQIRVFYDSGQGRPRSAASFGSFQSISGDRLGFDPIPFDTISTYINTCQHYLLSSEERLFLIQSLIAVELCPNFLKRCLILPMSQCFKEMSVKDGEKCTAYIVGHDAGSNVSSPLNSQFSVAAQVTETCLSAVSRNSMAP